MLLGNIENVSMRSIQIKRIGNKDYKNKSAFNASVHPFNRGLIRPHINMQLLQVLISRTIKRRNYYNWWCQCLHISISRSLPITIDSDELILQLLPCRLRSLSFCMSKIFPPQSPVMVTIKFIEAVPNSVVSAIITFHYRQCLKARGHYEILGALCCCNCTSTPSLMLILSLLNSYYASWRR